MAEARSPRAASRQGILWVFTAEALYAVMRIGTRLGARDLHWAQVAAIRFLGGAIVIALVARARQTTLRGVDHRSMWMRSLFGAGSALAVFYALGSRAIAVGDAATLSATSPLWVAALSAPMLGERLTSRTVLGLVLGFVGVVTLVGPSFGTSGPVVLISLAGALSYAVALIWLRRVGPRESSEAVALHVSLVSGCVLLVIALTRWRPITPGDVPLLLLTAACGGLGQVAITRGYALDSAARLSAISYAGAGMTYLLESLVLGRSPSVVQIAGLLLIAAAGIVVAGIFAVAGAADAAG